jgi:hypothetical protein
LAVDTLLLLVCEGVEARGRPTSAKLSNVRDSDSEPLRAVGRATVAEPSRARPFATARAHATLPITTGGDFERGLAA